MRSLIAHKASFKLEMVDAPKICPTQPLRNEKLRHPNRGNAQKNARLLSARPTVKLFHVERFYRPESIIKNQLA